MLSVNLDGSSDNDVHLASTCRSYILLLGRIVCVCVPDITDFRKVSVTWFTQAVE